MSPAVILKMEYHKHLFLAGKIDDCAVDNSVQANAHVNVPFDIVNLNHVC